MSDLSIAPSAPVTKTPARPRRVGVVTAHVLSLLFLVIWGIAAERLPDYLLPGPIQVARQIGQLLISPAFLLDALFSLLHIAGQLYTRTERYRRPTLSGELRGAGGPRDVMKEHADLMDATLKRNADLAVERLAEHYRRTGELIEVGLRRAAAE